MANQCFNITGELTQALLLSGVNAPINKVSLTNIEGTNACKVDLYVEKKLTGKFYLLKGVDLPIGATLIYDALAFSNLASEFGIYIKLTKSASETPAVDVIVS